MAKSMILYEKEIATLLSLPEEPRSHIITALLCVSVGNDIPALDPMETAVFELIHAQTERAAELSEKRRKNVKSRWENSQEDTKLIQNDTKPVQKNTKLIQNDTNLYNGDTNAYTTTTTVTPTITTTNTPLPPQGETAGENACQGESLKVKTARGKKSHSTTLDENDENFMRFWQAYPKKKAKDAALKAWKKLKPNSELLKIILNALEQQKCSAQWQKDGGQFIPYPATWLNGKRWEDAPEQAVQAPPPVHEFDPDDPYKDWK